MFGPATARKKNMMALNTRSTALLARRILAKPSSSRPLHLTDEIMESVDFEATKVRATGRERRGQDACRHLCRARFRPRLDHGHLPALPAFLHLPGGAEGAADNFLKKSRSALSGSPLFFPITR